MGVASLGGLSFDLDPDSITWAFSIKTRVDETVGGRVVQVFGTTISDMVLTGAFGKRGEVAQAGFLGQIENLMAKLVADPRRAPIRFRYPPRGWDFGVYVRNFTSVDGPMAIHRDPATYAYRYQLTLFVVDDNAGVLRRAATDSYIARLSAGIGWTPDKYNGTLTQNEVKMYLNKVGVTSIPDALIAEQTQLADPATRLAAEFGAG